ncbi:MAG: hypothetical protein K6F92_08830 [Lachnospiraceae bacterium]|nr:hypothetical protein [Lachnospiraceae bacterium]
MSGYKKLKPFKKMPFLVIAPVVSIIVEVVLIFLILHFMDVLTFNKQNMLGVKQVLIVGTIFAVIYGLFERLISRNREVKWYMIPMGNMFIPIAIDVIVFLVAMTKWWSNRDNQHLEFFMYLFATMAIYMAVASVIRLIFQFIVYLYTSDTPQMREKRAQKKEEKKAKKS